MIHFKNILIALAAVIFLVTTGCSHNTPHMQELVSLDSMVYHQQEK